MEQCLEIAEIIHLICDYARGPNEGYRKTLLAMALTCRQFLEPALDSLWYTIEDFRPLMGVLPSDIFEDVTMRYFGGNPQLGRRLLRVLDFNRALVPNDLQRYLSYYAPRIRVLKLSHAGIESTFATAAWQALHLVTGWKLGALAPRLAELRLCADVRPCDVGPDSFSENRLRVACAIDCLSYTGLFCGQDTVSVEMVFQSYQRLHVPSIRFLLDPLAGKLKKLKLQDINFPKPTDPRSSFVTDLIAGHRWQDLQVLGVQDVTASTLQHISTLPRLAILEISDLSGPPMHSISPDAMATPLVIYEATRNAFPSLRELQLASKSLPRITEFLKCILKPKHNRIDSIMCRISDEASTPMYTSRFLDTIQTRCSNSLRHLDVEDLLDCREKLDMPDIEGVDISPLYDCRMEHLSLCLAHDICLTPKDIGLMIESWPNIGYLKIDVSHANSRIPRLDHSHLMSLLYGCPRLITLGLRFDASQITGDEVPLDNNTPTLAVLSVGDSPIRSPSRVGLFLNSHCPNLRKGSLYYADSHDSRCSGITPQYMYCERWEKVEQHHLNS